MVFILATTEVHKLLPTILSRCQRFDFRRIAPGQMADRLDYVAGQEEAELDRDAALLIARLADGALRDALSLLDQCLGRSRHVDRETVCQVAGVAARDYLDELARPGIIWTSWPVPWPGGKPPRLWRASTGSTRSPRTWAACARSWPGIFGG